MSRIKVVVTGGAGFIGSHIVEHWINEGAEVHIIDNLRSGFISNVELFPEAIFHKGSVTDRKLVFDILRETDYVHHLAALVSVPESIEKPEECYDININGLFNVLDAAKEFGIKKVVFSSSAAVYGDEPESPQSIISRTSPKSPYGSTKLEGENQLKIYNEQHGLGTVSLRYFNVFGQRQNPKSQYAAAVPIFLTRALRNEPIIIYGDGEQTRDFIFVKDVVKANVAAATNEQVNGLFNIASGKSISINKLARLIIEKTNSKSEIVYEKERPGDVKHSLASIKETEMILQFVNQYSIETGLAETVNFFSTI